MMRVWYMAGILLLAAGCRKSAQNAASLPPVYTPNALEQWFEKFVMNRECVIVLARDSSGNDVTSSFDSTLFMLKKKGYHDGPFLATSKGHTDTGSWLANADYSKLTLRLSGKPAYALFNIDWKFKSKAIDKLDLIPWFTFNGNRQLIIVPK